MHDNTQPTVNETMNLVRSAIETILEPLKDGERITSKDLIDKVIAATHIKVSIANGIVPMILHALEEEGRGTLNIGRSGGWFVGGKKLRIDPRPRCETCHQVVRPKTNKNED